MDDVSSAAAPANTHQHAQTTKIVKNEGGEFWAGSAVGGMGVWGGGGRSYFQKIAIFQKFLFVTIKSGKKMWEKLAAI